MAQRYGTRPSRFIEGLNEFQALTLDYHAAGLGWEHERREFEKAKRR